MKTKIIRWSIPATLLSLATNVFAQVSTTTDSLTPGVPTTAIGGDWVINSVLLLMGVLVIGIAYAIYKTKDAA